MNLGSSAFAPQVYSKRTVDAFMAMVGNPALAPIINIPAVAQAVMSGYSRPYSNHRIYSFEPQEDITPFELAKILALSHYDHIETWEYQQLPSWLQRHFQPL